MGQVEEIHAPRPHWKFVYICTLRGMAGLVDGSLDRLLVPGEAS